MIRTLAQKDQTTKPQPLANHNSQPEPHQQFLATEKLANPESGQGRVAARSQSRSTKAVYLTTVLKYLAAEVHQLAGNAACDDKKQCIVSRHLQLAIQKSCKSSSATSFINLPGCRRVLKKSDIPPRRTSLLTISNSL
ncbi:hypothetical protein BDZ97DRAFT_1781071 [Flammula alnicola]|nr:hypothetical protein BDZ97DRAFT_1781071 [Flammula alnicola]